MLGDTSESMVDATRNGPMVSAYALIGREDRLLLIEHPGRYSLPGGAVHTGEPVEQALRRTLRDQLGAMIANLDFLVVIEYPNVHSGHMTTSELAFLFDVTLTNRDQIVTAAWPHRWASDRELSLLQPETIRNELATDALAVGRPWRAWTP